MYNIIIWYLYTLRNGHHNKSTDHPPSCLVIYFLLKIFLYYYFLREGKGGRKRRRETSKWERNIDWLALVCSPTKDQTCDQGMCPDRSHKPSSGPFAFRDDTQPTEVHQSGPLFFLWQGLKIYSLSNFPIYNTVLWTIVTMLYVATPWFIYFILEACAFWTLHSFCPPYTIPSLW